MISPASATHHLKHTWNGVVMMKREIVNQHTKIFLALFALLPFSSAYATHFHSAIVVDKMYVKQNGRVIVGNFIGTATTPAISITTSEPVTITDSTVQGPGDLIYVQNGNVTVTNTTGTGTNPNVANAQKGMFVHAESPTNLIVKNNTFSGVRFGVYVNNYSGNFTPTQTISILYNNVTNIDARPSDGNGGYATTGEYNGHAFQLNHVEQVPGIEIGWNQVINTPRQSQCSDLINIYQSSGIASSHILIHDNYLQGAYPVNPGINSKYTGGGVITDGTANDTAATATSFVDIYNNQMVSSANYGFATAAGHDNTITNNRVVSSGYLADGTFIPMSFANGLNNYNNYNQPATTFFNNVADKNYVGYIRSTTAGGATRSDWYLAGQPTSLSNTSWQPYDAMHPTITDEAGELTLWQQKVANAGLTIGTTN
jgi:hypothetical protein